MMTHQQNKTSRSTIAVLQVWYRKTELSRFCKIKFLLEKETHKKNKENHLKELDEIFRMVYVLVPKLE